jgi:hypothetical protein
MSVAGEYSGGALPTFDAKNRWYHKRTIVHYSYVCRFWNPRRRLGPARPGPGKNKVRPRVLSTASVLVTIPWNVKVPLSVESNNNDRPTEIRHCEKKTFTLSHKLTFAPVDCEAALAL